MKNTKQELTKFLKSKAKALKSDWADVPQWVIDASAEFMEKSKPSKRQEIINQAAELLHADGNEEIVKMIELIAKQKDETEIIDYIDGVDVWEKVQFSFTCEQFLEHIGYNKKDFKKK